jgi:beta-glucosidase
MKEFLKKRRKIIVVTFIFIFLLCCGPSAILSVLSFSYNRTYTHEISQEEILEFPEDFLWGAATASYQVEGGNYNSNWWRFEQEDGNIRNNDSAEITADHYNRYEEDIELMSEFNLNSYRFSIEWSRVEPQEGEFNEKEMKHYQDVLDTLEEEGIEPMVALVHHSYPAWFEDKGGWETRENIDYYLEYVEYVVDYFKDDVDLWITMNEPLAYISCGYITGKWPPGEKDITKVPGLISNFVEAHKEAYKSIHTIDPDSEVSLTEHISLTAPKHPNNIIENWAAFLIDKLWNHNIFEQIHEDIDFIGLQYYYKQEISLDLAYDVLTKERDEIEEGLQRLYYPDGLFVILMRLKKYDLPIYITEIGIPDYEEVDRDVYIREHARETYYAIQEGVDVKGFYYWSLLDSWEWTEGYEAPFGLITVDRETQERTVKDGSWEYSLIAGCNCVLNNASR